MAKKQTILIAIDASEHAKDAFDWYSKLPGAKTDKIVFHHCIDPPPSSAGMPFTGLPAQYSAETFAEVLQRYKKRAQKLETEYMGECQRRNLSCTWRESVRGPRNGLLEALEKEQADCVVMGTRGSSTTRRTVMGSVSRYMLNHAQIPVIIVPPKN